jgi:hypothetical protein
VRTRVPRRIPWLLLLLGALGFGGLSGYLIAQRPPAPILVPGRPAALFVTIYGARGKHGFTTQVPLLRNVRLLARDLNSLPAARTGGCPVDYGSYDLLRFVYPVGNRWIVRITTSGCQTVSVPGVGRGRVTNRFNQDLAASIPDFD